MSLALLLTRPCTIVRRAPGNDTNAYGRPIDEEETVETVCELQQKQRDESSDLGEVAQTDWNLFLPTATDIRFGDAIIVAGVEYEVIGEPWDATTGPESIWHIEATVRRTPGTADPQGS